MACTAASYSLLGYILLWSCICDSQYQAQTVKDISARFYEHAYSKSTRKHREVLLRKRMTQFGIHNFIIIGLELVNSETNIGQHKLHQPRAQYWQSKQGLRRGYNSIRVIKKKVNNRDGQLTVRYNVRLVNDIIHWKLVIYLSTGLVKEGCCMMISSKS
jgi:hypothetical protein